MKNGSSSDVVAKVVLQAVTSENPSLRYFTEKGRRSMDGSQKKYV